MRKIVAIVFAAVIGAIGAGTAGFAPVHAQTPEECAESDTAPPGCPPDGNYPVVLPPTVPPSTAAPVPPTTTCRMATWFLSSTT